DKCSPYLCDGKVATCIDACAGNADCVNGYACESNVCKVNVWINEIHYDDVDMDADEGVEIAGRAGTDLTGWRLVLYNGGDGNVYDTVNLSGTIPDKQGGKGTLWFAYVGLQNGASDGAALVDPQGKVVQFLCYEGTMTAADGPAKDVLCTDIGVAETNSTPDGESLQLKGTGSKYADFTWDPPKANTRGEVNTGQTLQ
ncbi:MAG: endonuclease I, partial [Deltaproteobacteria bacterium]|nr:endonuclease I [Deltaproteobacteria bacterium]